MSSLNCACNKTSFLISDYNQDETVCTCNVQKHKGIWPLTIETLNDEIRKAIKTKQKGIIINNQQLKLIRIIGSLQKIKNKQSDYLQHKIITFMDKTSIIDVLFYTSDNQQLYEPNKLKNKQFELHKTYTVTGDIQFMMETNEFIVTALNIQKTTDPQEIIYHNLEIKLLNEWNSCTESQKNMFCKQYYHRNSDIV